MPVGVWPHDQCLWPTQAHRQAPPATSPAHVLGERERGRGGGREGKGVGERGGGEKDGKGEK